MNSLLSKIKESIESKNFLEAEELSWALYSQNKTDFIAMKTLGLSLLLQNKYYGAIDIYQKALEKKKDNFDVLNNLSHLYLKIEEFEKSEELGKLANSINPDEYLPYVTLLDLYVRKRQYEDAYAHTVELLKRIKFETLLNNPNVAYLIFDTYLAANKKEDAAKLLRYFYSKVFNPDIFYYHSTFDPDSINKEIEKVAFEVLEKTSFENLVQKGKTFGPIYFGLAKVNEKKKNMNLSDDQYLKANTFVSDLLRYHPMSNQKMIKNIKKNFISEKKLDLPEHHDENLIFILGMPRSGTTLVESIIGSSSNAISGGELRSLYELFKIYYDEEDNDFFNTLDPGSDYLRRISYIRSDYKYFVDKLPGNIYNIGFIRKVFPRSKIIYLKRDPWDNAISIYKQFYVSNIPYSSSFFNIAVNYANHEELMRFWAEDMKINFLTINYESLVKNTEEFASKIFDYCQIDEKYSAETRKSFFARTASKNQVTKDVHTQSIGKKSFESKKADFIQNLENQRLYWKG